MDASGYYPEPLLRVGYAVMAIWRKRFPEFRQPTRSLPVAKLRKQLEEAYAKAEESVCASSKASYIRSVFLISIPNQVPRREVLLLVSLILWLEFADLGFHRSIGLICRIAGLVLSESDPDVAGAIIARKALGELLSSGAAIDLEIDQQISLTRQFRYFISMAQVPQEIGLTYDRLQRHFQIEAEYKAKHPSQQSQKRPLRRLNGRWQTQKRFEWKPGADSGVN